MRHDSEAVTLTGDALRLYRAGPDLLGALVAMQAAFVRYPGNADERHHALVLAVTAITKAVG
ncbi:MAG: hypothetical protein IMZ62_17245 [Chloroflexi bacterium]|nr:hypothetical protein [Chloroflexota bacterium]